MARNQEKANAMLNRFLAFKAEDERGPRSRRPFLASQCENLVQAEKWRLEVVREIGKKVAAIQNASWGEYRIREMNDEINKLIRERAHWQKRILELGGPDYRMGSAKDVAGLELKGSGGYMYFGAARDLPGVRELFEKAEAQEAKRGRRELQDCVDPDYYGYRDEDDGLLLPAEAEVEALARKALIDTWHESSKGPGKRSREAFEGTEDDIDVDVRGFRAHVPLPNHQDIEKAVLDRKKRDLLAKYASKELQAKEQEARALVGGVAK
eukprot:c40348_g1_i1.p1 GENE.c40348_g1_i1~~c40348_g1_i1.p1  ORF type:complete len:267 (-),score=69.32 c40348_g1_i1:792-1592(-)